MRLCDRFLPPALPVERVAARLGIISDTHMPDRCAAVPCSLFDALLGVDMLLHAGDVGDLWVLDGLSAIAPVIAVHGNDETLAASDALPYQQIIVAGGRRILLTHAHYPDRAEEMASRADDAWGPKLSRRAAMATAVGADIAVFGHTHIPMAVRYEGVLLINPGAIASANTTTRQARRTVALLFIRDDGEAFTVHIDLETCQPYVPQIDWEAGFRAALNHCTLPILAPDLAREFPRLREIAADHAPDHGWSAYRSLACSVWEGERDVISTDDLLAALRSDTALPVHVRREMIATLMHTDTLTESAAD